MRTFASVLLSNSVSRQRDEVRFADLDYTSDIPPAALPSAVMQVTKSNTQFHSVPNYVARRLLHALSGTCLWCGAVFCVTACSVPLCPGVVQTGKRNDSPPAVVHYGDIKHLHCVPTVLDPVRFMWLWVSEATLPTNLSTH